MAKPDGLVMVTSDGLRIPVDLKLHHVDDGVRFWAPVIEADLNAVMPQVVAFDGPPVEYGEAITFTDPGPGWNTREWGLRVMANSQHILAWYDDRPDEEAQVIG